LPGDLIILTTTKSGSIFNIQKKLVSIERNPFSAQNQTLRSYRVHISPTK